MEGRAITACLFDMDGLLLDTESAYTVAQQQICARFGKDFTWALKAKMMGKKALEAAQVLVDDLQLHGQLTAEAFVEEREKILDKLFAVSTLMPGVEKLVRHLHQIGCPAAVATSSHWRHFELKTSLHKELFSLFRVVVTGDMVERGKPAPDIFIVALEQLKQATGRAELEAARTLVFEDAPSGVDAGLAAGMKVVMVPDPNLDKKLCGKADEDLASLADFDPSKWGLASFDDVAK